MDANIRPFEFEYCQGKIRFGRGSVGHLQEELVERGFEHALVVCGANVAANREVMEPIEAGLGDLLAGVFEGSTPQKQIEAVYDGIECMEAFEADVLVSVGGGSSLDTAKAMSILAADKRSQEQVVDEIETTGVIPSPSAPITPLVTVPTTLAGADISTGAGIKYTRTRRGAKTVGDETHVGRFSDDRLMPVVLFYDPELFATTPANVLTASAMNGFDKGIETIYAQSTTPFSDAVAVRGLQLLRTALPSLASADADTLDQSVIGAILVQYHRQTNVIHAFGHGISYYYDIQQGAVHGIIAPHVLRYVFSRVDARRQRLAQGLCVDTDGRNDEELADAIVNAVGTVRDGLSLPSRLRTVPAIERTHLPSIAETIASDGGFDRAPPGLTPTRDDIEAVLREAW